MLSPVVRVHYPVLTLCYVVLLEKPWVVWHKLWVTVNLLQKWLNIALISMYHKDNRPRSIMGIHYTS